MYIATWNLNNRVGKRRFRPEAADAAIALNADVLVFTECFPQTHEALFRTTLSNAGWTHQFISEPPPTRENRVLIASKWLLERMSLKMPEFDEVFPANILGVRMPTVGLSIVGMRVPSYPSSKDPETRKLIAPAWKWLEEAAASLKHSPSLIIGDLNVEASSTRLRRILANAWHRAASGSPTFFGHQGKKSEIDHILATEHCILSDAACVQEKQAFVFSGSDALSDHSALICRVEVARHKKS